ncbi:MAG: hypothetical protein KDI36_09690 [Pseudomonadales bacterium]|nr:hypothetical protein [Pseudomonadales bacterium]
MNTDYDERITVPWQYWVVPAFFPAILLWLVSEICVAATSSGYIGFFHEPLTSTMLFLLAWGVMLFIAPRVMAVRLQIRDRLTWKGDTTPTLRIRGTRKGETIYIPFSMIESVERVQYESGWFVSRVIDAPGQMTAQAGASENPAVDNRSGWQKFFMVRTADSPVVTNTISQMGYTGPGLQLTYRAATLVSNGETFLWQQQFPTRDPETVLSILNHVVAS